MMSVRDFQERYWSNWTRGQDPYSVAVSSNSLHGQDAANGSGHWDDVLANNTKDDSSISNGQVCRPRRMKRRERLKGPHVKVCF